MPLRHWCCKAGQETLRTDNLKAIAIRIFLALTCIAFLQFSVGCGGGSGTSGGGPPPPPPPPTNPTPAITSLSPNSANEGGSAFTITVTGYNFISSSSVQWNGSARTTTYTSSTELQAQITAADIANSGSAQLSITNPAPGGGGSGAAEFIISPTTNPAPTVLSINPSSVNAGSPELILTVNGSNFLPTSTIEWSGVALSTSYLSDTQLEAQIPATDLAAPGVAEIVVLNPAPGGGVSTPLTFAINYQAMVVNQLANDMVWDATHQVIYLSVPSLASSNGNTVAALNPSSGSIQAAQFAGSEPDVLAISDDDQFLYTGLDGSSSVQRFTLPNLLPDIHYSLGAGPYPQGPYFGLDLQVAPGLPHTTAVSRGAFNVSPVALGGMAIFDDSIMRSTVADSVGDLYDSLQWRSDTAIYAINSEISSFDFYVLTANSNGVTRSKDYQNAFADFYVRMHYDSGTSLVYTDDGYVINPANGQDVGAFQASGYMVPDSTLNRAFFFGQIYGQPATSFAIESFDLTTLAPIAEITIPNVRGYPLRFIRWGTSGLAFNDDAGFVYIINDSTFVSGSAAPTKGASRRLSPVQRKWSNPKIHPRERVQSRIRSNPSAKILRLTATPQDPNPAPAISALSPSAVAAGEVGLNGFTLTVTGTNFVSLSTVEWNGSKRQTELVSSTELQAQINFSDVMNTGSATVSVVTPGPGGGASNTLSFSIVPQASLPPIPTLLALNPTSAMAGSAGLLVNLSGIWLSNSDTVDWNGSPRTNTSQGFLAAQVNASDIATPGYAAVTVVTPEGIVSNAAEFQILYQPTAVNQTTSDMVWDPLNQVFYISVPSSASTNPNQVCVLNPTTQAITNCQTGNQPNVLAISDDSQFLYVGMDGSNSVQRFILPSLTPDINFSVGTDPYEGPYVALDIEVAPGAPHTTAISRGILNLDPDTEGGIAIYDDGTQRPTVAPGWGPTSDSYDSIQWGNDATAIYAANSSIGSFDFYTLTVNSSGIVLNQDYPSVFWNPGRIHFDRGSGLVYSNDGFHAIDPSTGLPAGIFEVGGGWPMAPDSTLNTVFMLDQYIWQGYSNYTIDLYDMQHYVRVASIPFPTTALLGFNPPLRFIRWGSNGLAASFKGDKIYLLSGSFVTGSRKNTGRSVRRLRAVQRK
jgi:hypothetical protein